jgi:hypothetical protein
MGTSEAVELIKDALACTSAAGSARIYVFRGAQDVSALGDGPRLGDVGVAGFAMSRLARWVLTNSAAARDAEGGIDFTRRRYMIDFGDYAVLESDGKEWSGRSGRRLSTLSTRQPHEAIPFVFADLLAGISVAIEAGCEEIRGVRCRRLEGETPSDRTSTAIAASAVLDQVQMPMSIWIGDRLVRRIQVQAQDRDYATELWDFGTSVTQLDWTRLPVFRTVPEQHRLWTRQRSRAHIASLTILRTVPYATGTLAGLLLAFAVNTRADARNATTASRPPPVAAVAALSTARARRQKVAWTRVTRALPRG